MNDKELLELAAKAAGYKWETRATVSSEGKKVYYIKSTHWVNGYERHKYWEPLTDDGDALRLAVKLGMQMYIWQPNDGIGVHYTEINRNIKEKHGSDSCAATRRAIVRAAAEIGRMM